MKTKLIMKWAAAATLACITTTLSAQLQLSSTTLINDSNYTGAVKTGGTITTASGTYTQINPANDASGMAVSSSQITLNTGGNSVLYRGFDDGFKIKLNKLDAGESIILKFNLAAAESLTNNSLLSFGFTSYGLGGTNANVAYVADNIGGGYTQTGFFYRYTDNWLMSDYGTKVGSQYNTGNILADLQAHDITFAIKAQGSGSYLLSAIMDTDTTILAEQAFTWNTTMADTFITGVSFRESQGSKVAFNSLSVTYNYFAMVPEPSTVFLLGSGAALLAFLRRRK